MAPTRHLCLKSSTQTDWPRTTDYGVKPIMKPCQSLILAPAHEVASKVRKVVVAITSLEKVEIGGTSVRNDTEAREHGPQFVLGTTKHTDRAPKGCRVDLGREEKSSPTGWKRVFGSTWGASKSHRRGEKVFSRQPAWPPKTSPIG